MKMSQIKVVPNFDMPHVCHSTFQGITLEVNMNDRYDSR